MDLVSHDFDPEVLKPRNKRNPVARRPRIDWTSVPAHGRMLVGAPARKPLRRPPPLYRPPLSRTKTKKEEDSMPNLGLWWQVLRDEREEDQERMRQLQTRIHVKEMRDMLPRLDARAVLRHRKGVAAVLEGELREDGFVQTADTISHLLELNDHLLETAQRYKLKWRVCKLRKESELLVELAKKLMEAETANNSKPPDLKEHADIMYKLAMAMLFHGEPYYWLVEQLLLLLVEAVAGFRQDDGFREARARYFYGFLLAEKIGHQEFAREQLEESRKICAGKLWTLNRKDRKLSDIVLTKSIYQEYVMEEAHKGEMGETEDEDDKERNKKAKEEIDQLQKGWRMNSGRFGREDETNKALRGKVGDKEYEKVKEEGGKERHEEEDKMAKAPQHSKSGTKKGNVSQLRRVRLSIPGEAENEEERYSVHLEYVLEQRHLEEEQGEEREDATGAARPKSPRRGRTGDSDGDSDEGSEGGDVIEVPHDTLYLCVLEMMARVLVRLARAVRREDPREAVRLCSVGLRCLGAPELEPRRNMLLFELGLSYEVMKDYEMALSCFQGYVEQPEEHLELVGICSAYLEIAFCYRSLGNKEMATEYLYKVLDRSENSDNNELIGVAHRFLGQGLLLMARYSEASDRLEEAMKLFLDLKQYEDADRVRIIHGITKGYEVMPYMASLLNDCDQRPRGVPFRSLLDWKLHHIPFFSVKDESTPRIPDEDLYRIILEEGTNDPRYSSLRPSLIDRRITFMQRRRSFRYNLMEDLIWEKLDEVLPSDDEHEKREKEEKPKKVVSEEELIYEDRDDKMTADALREYSLAKAVKWKPREDLKETVTAHS